MKRQRFGKVFPAPDAASPRLQALNMQNPNADLWLSPYSFRKTDPEGSEVVLQDHEKRLNSERSSSEEDSIHIVAVPLIFLGQCFGLLPLHGFLSNSPGDLTFRWCSMKVVYAVVLILLNLILTVGQIHSAVTIHGITFYTIDNILASMLTAVQVTIFLQQARTWPALVASWTGVERGMRHFHPLIGLASTVRYLVYVYGMSTMFLLVARIMPNLTALYDCSDSMFSALALALLTQYNALPLLSAVAPIKTLLLAILLVQETVVLVFDNLMITVLAYALYLRFRQLNNHLQKVSRQRLSVQYWAEMRIIYNSLSNLADHLNSHLSWMTLVCFGSSLYDICSLLHSMITPMSHDLAKWSILYVLMFSVLRTFSAALVASSISEESKKPLFQMFSVPSESYSAEVCRFQMQVTHGHIVLSGLGFFSVTRSFMLTVAGTIATYEIVLIQFGTNSGPNTTSYNNTDFCYDTRILLE